MKNEFVPYDIALAMKELGFDDGCIAWYYHEELRYMNLEDDVPVKNNIELTGTYETDKYCYAAPLYQQAFRWFREEHKLSGDVFPVFDDPFKQGGSYHACLTDLSGEEWLGDEELGLHRNYEEAQEACLRKLIEIVNQNKVIL